MTRRAVNRAGNRTANGAGVFRSGEVRSGEVKAVVVLAVLVAVVAAAVIAFAVLRTQQTPASSEAPTAGVLPGTRDEAPATEPTSGGADPALDLVLSGEPRERAGGLLSDAMSGAGGAQTIESTPEDDDPEAGAETGEPDGGAVASADGSLPASSVGGSAVDRMIERADELAADGELVEARAELAAALADDRATARQLERARARARDLNDVLVFSDRVVPGDPMTSEYRVASGDSLSRIASRQELLTHWKLIARLNGIKDPTKIRVGQRLKLVRGPFHAVVDKSDFRMDVYHGSPDSPTSWTYVTSFPVGLGTDDGTPAGSFVVSDGKLENPGWVNPRDHTERYNRDDPRNPIGEFWIGLDGIGDSASHTGYGIHGTIDPNSIGRSESMGCVRLRDDDVALAYELLTEGISVVHIVE